MARFEGTPGNDRITGKENPRNVIHGYGGDDVLIGGKMYDRLVGGGGDDRLYGGPGADDMIGGAGADRFVFVKVADAASDVIFDFEQGKDLLVLKGEFHAAGTLHFIGDQAFSGTPGEVQYFADKSGSSVQIDMDGDGVRDATVFFRTEIQFQASDFVF